MIIFAFSISTWLLSKRSPLAKTEYLLVFGQLPTAKVEHCEYYQVSLLRVKLIDFNLSNARRVYSSIIVGAPGANFVGSYGGHCYFLVHQ